MQITEQMILAAAQAIHQRFGNRSGFGKQWSALTATIKQQYLDEAKAALKAALAAA